MISDLMALAVPIFYGPISRPSYPHFHKHDSWTELNEHTLIRLTIRTPHVPQCHDFPQLPSDRVDEVAELGGILRACDCHVMRRRLKEDPGALRPRTRRLQQPPNGMVRLGAEPLCGGKIAGRGSSALSAQHNIAALLQQKCRKPLSPTRHECGRVVI